MCEIFEYFIDKTRFICYNLDELQQSNNKELAWK
jgi:hypothetical protein